MENNNYQRQKMNEKKIVILGITLSLTVGVVGGYLAGSNNLLSTSADLPVNTRGNSGANSVLECTNGNLEPGARRTFNKYSDPTERKNYMDWANFANFSPKKCHYYTRNATWSIEMYSAQEEGQSVNGAYLVKVVWHRSEAEFDYSSGTNCSKEIKKDPIPDIIDYYYADFATKDYHQIGESDFNANKGKIICKSIVENISKSVGEKCPCEEKAEDNSSTPNDN